MKLYHITLNHNIEILKQQIPQHVMKGENTEIARISASESIGHCFKAVPWSNEYFSKWKNNFFESEDDRYITVFEIDTSKIEKENLLFPKEVRNLYGVEDAEDTTEHWIINEEITPCDKYKILPLYLREGYSIMLKSDKGCDKCLVKDCERCVDEVPRFCLEDYERIIE